MHWNTTCRKLCQQPGKPSLISLLWYWCSCSTARTRDSNAEQTGASSGLAVSQQVSRAPAIIWISPAETDRTSNAVAFFWINASSCSWLVLLLWVILIALARSLCWIQACGFVALRFVLISWPGTSVCNLALLFQSSCWTLAPWPSVCSFIFGLLGTHA